MRLTAVFLAALGVVACGVFASRTPAHGEAAKRPRIVSLMPSLTEDLFAIGAGEQVVGTSQFSDFPPQATRIPQVASSASIDVERIISLHPDVIVGIPSQRAFVAQLERVGLRAVTMADDSFDDLFRDLAMLGRLAGHEREAARVATRLRARTARLVHQVGKGVRPRCFVVLGVVPIFTVGDRSYIAHLIALAGGRNAAGELRGSAYGRYSAEVLLAEQPDVLIGDAQSGLDAALNQPPWNALRAVRRHRVYILQNADILERPGPRYNEGLAWLISRLHPRAHGT